MTQEEIIIFLKKLTEDLEKGDLTSEQQLSIYEFYLSYIFINKISCEEEEEEKEKEILKYASLGWYIYSNMKT